MSINNKSIEQSILILSDEEIESLVNELSLKYQSFKEINSVIIGSMLRDIVVPENSSTLQIKAILDKEILSYLCTLVRNSNKTDIVDEFLSFYGNTFDHILNRFGFTGDTNSLKRKILLELINDYVGQADFINMYARYSVGYLKNKITKDKIDEIINETSNEFYTTKIEDISLLGSKLDILREISLDNPKFIKFVMLKFGYNGYYASDEDIKRVLSISDEEFNEFMNSAVLAMSNAAKSNEKSKATIK